MASNTGFFGERDAKAVLKHGILARYAPYFAVRGGHGVGGRVAFIDGYAGEGRYKDGSPGSPLILATTADQSSSFERDVKLAFVEPNPKVRKSLVNSLAEAGVSPDVVADGDLASEIPNLLHRYRDRAVFLFVDPFGLAIDRRTLDSILKASSPRQPIDVLYHFSLSSLARMATAAMAKTTKSKVQHADRALDGISWQDFYGDASSEHQPATTEEKGTNGHHIDRALGVPWRDLFENVSSKHQPTMAALRAAELFASDVKKRTGVGSVSIPVRERPHHTPKYNLILFSRNANARWDFLDQAGNAYSDWLQHCGGSDYDANGAQNLFNVPRPERTDVENRIEQDANSYLPNHLRDVVRTHKSIRPVDAPELIYGKMLGKARVKHIRAAMKDLHRHGTINDDCKNKFWTRSIQWSGD